MGSRLKKKDGQSCMLLCTSFQLGENVLGVVEDRTYQTRYYILLDMDHVDLYHMLVATLIHGV